ncbi:metallophosphoesterase [Saccharospirillum salsuginis]|uniref:3',5'-cyclic adenosine monophosphate phosphodiesterase CpdA n=1 Tax=Saccharospirillum salsuginis TaxID=418750 RepID=A0A918NC70_9GAMM|nr:metallophosphoesterase [Saccharospirillum salsuginis]GGX57660.1 3',5'-cyclic adenosine monophosphate phosphodiesterase CpdA [Saccharospirillum salsuginis]
MDKYIVLSDLHVTGKGLYVQGGNSDLNYINALSHIASNHRDARAIFCMGDISNNGSASSYEFFSKCNEGISIPCYTILGNHDEISNAKKHINLDIHQERFVQFYKVYNDKAFIFLDTTEEELESGCLCEFRLEWLDKALSLMLDSNIDVYIFMHHNPFDINVRCYEKIGLRNSEQFYGTILRYKAIVKHIFFGHCHQNIHGIFKGVTYTAVKGTNHQIYPDLSNDSSFKVCDFEPSYYVLLFDRENFYSYDIEFNKKIVSEIQ